MTPNHLKLLAETLAMQESWQVGKVLDRKFTLTAPLSSKPVPNAYLATEIETGDTVVLRRCSPGSERSSLEREWEALSACRGEGVQHALALYPATGFIAVEYYPDMIPLIEMSPHQAETFTVLLPELLKAMRHCHHAGWIHGDIKPSNVLWDPADNRVCLIDFGAALPIGLSRKNLTSWHMSKGFSPDRQAKGEGTVQASDDWFALMRWLRQMDKAALSDTGQQRIGKTMDWLRKQP
ncbi:protein kinase domain-containing protein [Enterovibrio norvegicus]|uniref:protein kinase domain-containing protein n=1 Tax=Enterovibrio norvegicus TaxID=188144 RepID=UPI00354C48AC